MAWLLLFVPPLREAPVNRYDVLERNVVEHEDVWRVKVGGVVIEARAFRATRTESDPELRDREAWPVEQRRMVRHVLL